EDCLSEKMMDVQTPEQNRPAGSIGSFAGSGFEVLGPNLPLNDFVLEAVFPPGAPGLRNPLPGDGEPGGYTLTRRERTTRARLMYQAYHPFDDSYRQAAQRFVLFGDPALSPDLGSPTLTAKVNGVGVEDVSDPFFASSADFQGPVTVEVTASEG